jgi:hypothetical protein
VRGGVPADGFAGLQPDEAAAHPCRLWYPLK